MIVELKPETERIVQEEIRRGRFHSVDEVIVQAVYASRESVPQSGCLSIQSPVF
jgi:Arc/MetJ-type ribon-helix-helix transcriptional regulator